MKINILRYNWVLVLFALSACVPAVKLQDEKALRESVESENATCRDRLQQALQDVDNLTKQLTELQKEAAQLRTDTTNLNEQYARVKALNKDLDDLYNKVILQNKDLLTTSTLENKKLSVELENKERDLAAKEEKLAKLEANLQEKETNINSLSKGLKDREAKVQELEAALKQKEEAANALKNKISNALLGFDEGELSVEQRNGKVYVSLSEKLLFKSGQTTVDPKGQEALKKLADVLKKNQDINVLIEGHTDDVPMTPNARISSNWDLSVLRATSIVNILTKQNGIDPKRVTAAGRGEYFPIADNKTPEGRAKNRRTEIILTPKLDEVLDILNNN